ncbi:MAG: hypothetical protein GX800_02965, partial [Clostridiaceae bacterium]|nr:hypothetical protein [Clostridiaceae bacterium]
MIKTSKKRHILALLLTVAVMLTLIQPMAVTVSATGTDVEDLIAELEYHGFTAVYDDVDTVTVTGNVSAEDTALWDYYLNLYIPDGITVDWQASVTGESSNNYWLELYGDGTFLMSGGLIEMTVGENNDSRLIFINNYVTFVIDGGTVRNECSHGYAIEFLDDSEYTYISGTVEGDINFDDGDDGSDPFEGIFLTAGEH